MKPNILVVGSINMDLVFKTPRMPAPGETLIGESFHQVHGGKGANQAVAAARMGGAVQLIACVGDDDFGRSSVEALTADGIDTHFVRTIEGCATGVAGILLDQHGENSIVLAAGANGLLSRSDIDNAEAAISKAQMLICQLETPMDSVTHAISCARAEGIAVMLNPAPMQKLEASLLAQIDFLVLNETEASQLSGFDVANEIDAKEAAVALMKQGAKHVIITLGAAGIVVASPETVFSLPAYVVKVVDTTAAGDTFVGSLAVALAEGMELRAACDLAQRAAALTVTQLGAQTSIPHRETVERHFHKQ